MPNSGRLQIWFQAEEPPLGIEGIKSLAEIWVPQVRLKHPNVNTIATESGIFCRQIVIDTTQTSSPSLYLYG